jgi:PAS domain S-box-containing protein
VSEGASAVKVRVIIVDDDPALLDALPAALRLRMKDIDAETADSAEAALELIAVHDYDAIVTDIKMPGMDGLALLEEIRRLRPETPTLLITGHGEQDLTMQALRGGAYDFIQKPIERDYFFASLMRAIQKRQLAREVEQQRLELERHVRVLEHVGDGVFLIDDDGVIRLWNSAAAAITGLAGGAAVGRRADELLGGWDALSVQIPVASVPGVHAPTAASLPLEIDGREVWLAISGVQFDDGTVYAFQDLTAEHAVAKLKDDFVATASHELRTPLAAIYGAAKTLERKHPKVRSSDRERLLAVIAQEADRLARVVNEILLASHLDSGQLVLANEPVDAVEIARGVLESLEPYAEGKVSLSLVAAPSMPRVRADPDKLRQVLINLVENAIKYSPGGGPVELRIEAEDSRVRFAVRDEGLGISAQEHQRIFDKFYRVDPHLTRGVGGTGLGLYVCKELAHRMGGRISLESEPGVGSTFYLDLSLLEAEAAAQKPERPLAVRTASE